MEPEARTRRILDPKNYPDRLFTTQDFRDDIIESSIEKYADSENTPPFNVKRTFTSGFINGIVFQFGGDISDEDQAPARKRLRHGSPGFPSCF
jgi:hypothetical protein